MTGMYARPTVYSLGLLLPENVVTRKTYTAQCEKYTYINTSKKNGGDLGEVGWKHLATGLTFMGMKIFKKLKIMSIPMPKN